MSNDIIFHTVVLLAAAVMLFCALLVWKKTRDTTWVLIVIGVIAWYIQILLSFLTALSLIPPLPLAVRIIVHVLPLTCVTIALIHFNPKRDLL